jgi:hypothetical protein
MGADVAPDREDARRLVADSVVGCWFAEWKRLFLGWEDCRRRRFAGRVLAAQRKAMRTKGALVRGRRFSS